MPAPEETQSSRPVLGHVNLMVDTLIANANLNDLQAIVRATLATSPPSTASTFTAAARRHLARANATATPRPGTLFSRQGAQADGPWGPTTELPTVLARSRMLYGAGMGVAAIAVLTGLVQDAAAIRWVEDSPLEDLLATIDADITQAIQSAKEEYDAGRISVETAKEVCDTLRAALLDNREKVRGWGGDFPFERALSGVELWKL
ncbi:hypothetical protein C8Q79DRAFT_694843 [Trametes meyenii]|nr:hypothetical protein C8Q79DRAFT_694843 [Trametes meyenii]